MLVTNSHPSTAQLLGADQPNQTRTGQRQFLPGSLTASSVSESRSGGAGGGARGGGAGRRGVGGARTVVQLLLLLLLLPLDRWSVTWGRPAAARPVWGGRGEQEHLLLLPTFAPILRVPPLLVPQMLFLFKKEVKLVMQYVGSPAKECDV